MTAPTLPRFLLAIALASGLMTGARAADQLEQLSSPELRARIAAGATTILIPIGGTEQNGPHMALGKHNMRAGKLAALIAAKLGNAIVAPVIAYVPEGAVRPPAAHMRFSGTISIPDAAFEAMLEGAARSFRQHGFRDIVFLGDHGGYQKNEERVAARLNREWAGEPAARAHALLAYYNVSQGAYVDALKRQGYSAAEIGTHAGLADTALTLALDPSMVRSGLLDAANRGGEREGVHGDPRRARADSGQAGVELIVAASVEAIHALQKEHAK